MRLDVFLSGIRDSEPYSSDAFFDGIRGLSDSAGLIYAISGAGVYPIRAAAERLWASDEHVREFVDRLRTSQIPVFSALWVDRNRFYLYRGDEPVDVEVDRTAPCLRSELRYLEFPARDALRAQAFAEFRARIEPLISIRGWNTFTIDDLSLLWASDRGAVRDALSLLASGIFDEISILCLPAGEYVMKRDASGVS